MTGFLIDEMFPPETATLLRDQYGHDALHVMQIGLGSAADADIARRARDDGRAVVTENMSDFAAETDVTLVFVLKKRLPTSGGQAVELAARLDRWASEHSDPYLGHHWPS